MFGSKGTAVLLVFFSTQMPTSQSNMQPGNHLSRQPPQSAWHNGARFLPFARMRPIRAWLIYVFLVFFGGALVAPWLYWAAQSLAMHFGALQHLADRPFHRFVNRSLLLLALAGLWALLRTLGVGSWASVGLTPPRGQWRNLGAGFAWGFATLALVAGIGFLSGARSWNSNLTPLVFVKGLSGALVSAVVVALIEEVLFRGALLGSLRHFHPSALALLISSGFYALVH